MGELGDGGCLEQTGIIQPSVVKGQQVQLTALQGGQMCIRDRSIAPKPLQIFKDFWVLLHVFEKLHNLIWRQIYTGAVVFDDSVLHLQTHHHK